MKRHSQPCHHHMHKATKTTSRHIDVGVPLQTTVVGFLTAPHPTPPHPTSVPLSEGPSRCVHQPPLTGMHDSIAAFPDLGANLQVPQGSTQQLELSHHLTHSQRGLHMSSVCIFLAGGGRSNG